MGLLIGIALPRVLELRLQGADVVVLLTHLPAVFDEALATYLPGIDAVVGGHDHLELAETVVGPGEKLVPVIHAGAYYRKLGKVVLSIGGGIVSVRSAELLAVDQRVPRPSPAQSPVAAQVAWLQAVLPAMFPPGTFDPADPFHAQIPLAFAEKNVSNELNMKVPKRDTGAGNLVTDALRAATGTEIAFTVTGQTPQGIAAGPVVQEDLLRMVGVGLDSAPLPRIAQAEVRGDEILKALGKTIAASLLDDDFILQVSGMKYVYDSSREPGERIVSVEIGGAPLDTTRDYSVTMNALLFQMLDVMDIETKSGEVLDVSEFAAVRDYVAGLGSFVYAGENRVRDLAVQGRKNGP